MYTAFSFFSGLSLPSPSPLHSEKCQAQFKHSKFLVLNLIPPKVHEKIDVRIDLRRTSLIWSRVAYMYMGNFDCQATFLKQRTFHALNLMHELL